MRSSTSSSEDASRKYDRRVPDAAWPRILLLSVVLLAACTVGWEIQMRSLGLITADVDDGNGHWAAERRKVDTHGRDAVVIIGSSRILFDTNLDIWEELTGVRPIQLALPGTNPGPFLEDLAKDEDFAGLLVIGITPTAFFREDIGLFSGALDYYADETPSQRFGHWLSLLLHRAFAFLDSDYALFKLISRIPMAPRGEARDPYDDVWKISVNDQDRQTFLWQRIETDEFLRDHARAAWNDFDGDPVDIGSVMNVIETTRRDINQIRARGGDVVFVRPPSNGPLRENEHKRAPREEVWDTLIRGTGTVGIHFEDHPDMMGLQLPEFSHLSRESAQRYTRAYVRVIGEEISIPGAGQEDEQ
ncbi:MAG: hypothetical protein ACR2QU_09850 [Gammaproteobacteria bacterium]